MVGNNDVSLQKRDKNGDPLHSGVTVLVVDCDTTSLVIMSRMLHVCGYKVITVECARDAFHILEKQQDYIDLILTELHLPDMDKYQLLERLGEISSIPIVIMSADNDEKAMLGSLFKGIEFYLVKPITMNIIENIWQFSYRNKREVTAQFEYADNFNGESQKVLTIDIGCKSHSNSVKAKTKKRKDEMEKDGNGGCIIVQKKQKLIWTNDLHKRFLQVVDILGIDDAHPKKILQHMNVPGLKKEHISSHLQKYRLSLKRNQGAVQNNMITDYNTPYAYNSSPKIIQHLATSTICPPELRCRFCSYNTYSMDYLSSTFNPIHIDSGHNDMSMSCNRQLSSQSNQLYTSQSNSVGGLSSFDQMGDITDVFVPTCVETSLTQQTEDIQELLQLMLPPLSPIPLEPQQKDGIFGADYADIDLFDLSKWSNHMCYDILDSCDLW